MSCRRCFEAAAAVALGHGHYRCERSGDIALVLIWSPGRDLCLPPPRVPSHCHRFVYYPRGRRPTFGGQRWTPGGWEVNGGSRAVVGPPGVPEFCEGSSTGPGGFAGHLGVRASAIMPDVVGPVLPSLSHLGTSVANCAWLCARCVSRCVTFRSSQSSPLSVNNVLQVGFRPIQAQRRRVSSARACNAESSGMRQSVKSLLSRVVIQILAFQSFVPRMYNLISL